MGIFAGRWPISLLGLALCACGVAGGDLPTPLAVPSSPRAAATAPITTDNDLPYSGPANNGLIGLGDSAQPARRPAKRAVSPAEDGLFWLAAHQSANGGWDADGFGGWCTGERTGGTTEGPGASVHDVGVTGLALTAFLNAGYTNRGRHPFAKTVSKGLRYLKRAQDEDGCFAPRTHSRHLYDHAMAALAMVEAYGMTHSPIFRKSAQRGLDFTTAACTEGDWRAWNTSIASWMLLSLHVARLVNEDRVERGKDPLLTLDDDAPARIREWLEGMTDPVDGRVGYTRRGAGPMRYGTHKWEFPATESETMTAAAVFGRMLLGEEPSESAPILDGLGLLQRLPPRWDERGGSIDLCYWYFGTQAACRVGGPIWKTWNQARYDHLLAHRIRDGEHCGLRGSWDPVGVWGGTGGRVYATALAVMILGIQRPHHHVMVVSYR